MKINSIHISIITLTKNNSEAFLKTLRSIRSQKYNFYIEWIIVDGSDKNIQEKNYKFIAKLFNKNKDYILIKYIDSKKKNISGIFPCMNYGKKVATGKFIIFLNSGDIFYDSKSLGIFFKNSQNANPNKSLIFSQANIISSNKINWLFPGNNLKNIDHWLRFFEPNHQSMLISSDLAFYFDFSEYHNIVADGYWKREIIKNANDIIYIKTPLVKFFLGGISSLKPSKKLLEKILKNKKISLFRKIIFTLKYIFPENLFYLYNHFQKYKSLIIDLIF